MKKMYKEKFGSFEIPRFTESDLKAKIDDINAEIRTLDRIFIETQSIFESDIRISVQDTIKDNIGFLECEKEQLIVDIENLNKNESDK